MKFVADENFPRPAVDALRGIGLDLICISEGRSGLADDEILELCVAEGRILLTFDKDFGELAFVKGLPASCGIVLFRLLPQSPEEIATIAVSALQSQPSWAGYFSVITRQNIRMRPLPAKLRS